jgi:hypothetical protein
MTAFETLIYTDCRPGQGLAGTAGLQFQAESDGAPPESQALAKNSVLYEAPSNWMRERRPAEAYPPSFAHIWDRFYITAAGLYLGREANGTREGNQLTHCLVTGNADSYLGSVRPGQLYGAPFWTREPAPTTTCPPLDPGWEPGPLDVERVHEFVHSQPRGQEMLHSLACALHHLPANGPRVLFVSEDVTVVMSWIVAGTLLLPQEQALRTGFKVFSTDPARAPQPIVAVHPAWDSTPARVGNDLGYIVFDLTNHTNSPSPDHPVGAAWAKAFWEADDPYEVVEAVEVAGQSGLEPKEAVVLGRVAALHDELHEDNAKEVTTWLRNTSPDLLESYRGPMVDRLLSDVDQWSMQILLDLDDLIQRGQVPADRSAAVRVAQIRIELREATRTGNVRDIRMRPLPDGHWQREHQNNAEQALLDQLQTAATPRVFEALLRLGGRFGLEVQIGRVGPALDEFVRDWAASSGRGYDPRYWPPDSAEFIEDRIVDELSRQAPRDGRGAKRFAQQWLPMLRRRLANATDFDDPLWRSLLGEAVATSSPPERAQLIGSVLASIRGRPHGDYATGETVSALWTVASPSRDELVTMMNALPASVPLEQRIFDGLSSRLMPRPSVEDLDLAHELVHRGLYRPPQKIPDLLYLDRILVDLCRSLVGSQSENRFTQLMESLTQFAVSNPGLLRIRSTTLARAALEMTGPKHVSALMEGLTPIAAAYFPLLVEVVREKGRPVQAAIAFYLARRAVTSDRMARELRSAVGKWVREVDESDCQQATTIIKEIGPRTTEEWEDMLSKELDGNKLKRLLPRRWR